MTAALHNVTKSYQFAPGAPAQVVLRDLHLEIPAGSATAIMGASGCGKSTLLQIMGTLDTPDAGSVRLFDQEVAGLDDAALSRLRAEKIGFIFQLHHLLPHLTALENVLVPVLSGGAEKGTDYAARGRELLARAGAERDVRAQVQLAGLVAAVFAAADAPLSFADSQLACSALLQGLPGAPPHLLLL